MKVYIIVERIRDDFSYIETPDKVFLDEMNALEYGRNKIGCYYIEMEVEDSENEYKNMEV